VLRSHFQAFLNASSENEAALIDAAVKDMRPSKGKELDLHQQIAGLFAWLKIGVLQFDLKGRDLQTFKTFAVDEWAPSPTLSRRMERFPLSDVKERYYQFLERVIPRPEISSISSKSIQMAIAGLFVMTFSANANAGFQSSALGSALFVLLVSFILANAAVFGFSALSRLYRERTNKFQATRNTEEKNLISAILQGFLNPQAKILGDSVAIDDLKANLRFFENYRHMQFVTYAGQPLAVYVGSPHSLLLIEKESGTTYTIQRIQQKDESIFMVKKKSPEPTLKLIKPSAILASA
jgi:hypothetical protein